MKPVKFPGSNIVYGLDQPQYQPMPAMVIDDPEGTMITCWQLTPEELKKISISGKIYIQVWTFKDDPQPILPMADLGDNIELV